MKKDNSIIIGSGVIGSYLAKFLLSKRQKIIVTSRKRKKSYTNYNKLNIENKIIFEKLNFLKKNEILVLKGPKNYLIKAIDTSYDRTKSNDEMDKLYERQVAMNFDEQIMQSFDKFLNNKYKVKINQKVLDRITNSF